MNTIKKAAKLFNLFYIDLQGNVDYSDLSLEEAKEQIQIVVDNYLDEIDIDLIHYKDKSYRDVDQIRCLDILTTCLSATNSDFNDLSVDEFFDLILEIQNDVLGYDDVYLNSLPCGEIRIIDKDEINQIWEDSLIETVKECYGLSVYDAPSLAIDWEATAKNCMADGMGVHFAGYDHQEHSTDHYYIFRTN